MRSRDNEEVRDGAGLAIMESDQILILHGEIGQEKDKSSAIHSRIVHTSVRRQKIRLCTS